MFFKYLKNRFVLVDVNKSYIGSTSKRIKIHQKYDYVI